MELRKSSSGDWDVLAKNKGMIIGDTDSEGGLDLTLGLFYPIEITILPQEGKTRVEVFYRTLRQSIVMEIPLAIQHEMTIPLEWSLGILRRIEGISIEWSLVKIVKAVCLLLEQPLHTKPEKIKILVPLKGEPKFEVWFKGTPKSKRKTVATIKELAKLLKSD